MHKVFLDSNVILSGALKPGGPAGRVKEIKRYAKFVINPYVQSECSNILQAVAGVPEERKKRAQRAINEYLRNLSVEHAANRQFDGARCPDPNDQVIYDTALVEGCEFICTYDYNGFPHGPITVCAPLALFKKVNRPDRPIGSEMTDEEISTFVQEVILGTSGTFMFLGQFMALGKPFRLLEGRNFRVYVDADRFIKCAGINIPHYESLLQLDTIGDMALVIRFKPGLIEALRWRNPFRLTSNQPPELLMRGACIAPNLVTAPYNQTGAFPKHFVHSFSGTAKFMKEKVLRAAIHTGTLEVWDSVDVRLSLLHSGNL
jgi:predicted nucleic acid-binding protein